MTTNAINRVFTSTTTDSSHGKTNCSRFVQDQSRPRANCGISRNSNYGGYPQSRVSQAGRPNPRQTGTNQPIRRAPVSTIHLVPSKNGSSDVPGWAGNSEQNFLDLALQESSEVSDDEWEEVTPPSTRPPTNLEVVGPSSLTRTSVEGKGQAVNRSARELPREVGKGLNPSTSKRTVSFKEKATELARSTGRLLAPSRLLPSRNLTVDPPFSTAEATPSISNMPPRLCTQPVLDSLRATSKLFTSKGFSHHVQNLRERKTKETQQQFHERYDGAIVENARQNLTGLMAVHGSSRSQDVFKGGQPAQRCRARRNANGKRVTKAQAEAENVRKICQCTKSYIVDMAAIKRRELPTLPGPQHSPPTTTTSHSRAVSTRTEKTALAIPPPLPAPEFPSTSLGSVPRGLQFTKKLKVTPEPGQAPRVTIGGASSKQEIGGPRPSSSSDHNGQLMVDVPKRRPENSGVEFDSSTPRKKPRLGRR